MSKKTKIALVKADEYNSVDEAVFAALDLIEVDKVIQPNDTLLLKPNLLLKNKDACTEGDFIQGIARYLKKINTNISLGDSPGQFGHKAKNIVRLLSIDKIMEEENIAYVEFEGEKSVKVENPDAKIMRSYFISRPVHETDVIINLPRPKTHLETAYTGAIKNYWGVIPGSEKSQCHVFGGDPISFGNVIVDNLHTLNNTGKKRITIMDGRKFMVGPAGPAKGPMRKTNVIIAGYNEAAVDMIMLAIAGINGLDVPHLKACGERGLGITDLDEIEILGKSIDEVRLKKKIRLPWRGLVRYNSFMLRNIVLKMVRRIPSLTEKDCIKCGDCSKLCPVKAIDWQKKNYPVFRTEKCISCLCCIECCPEQALKGKSIGIKGLFMKKKSGITS